MRQVIRYILISLSVATLSACSTFTGEGKDNTPAPAALIKYTAQVAPKRNWSADAGGDIGKTYLNLPPVLNNNTVFISNPEGKIVALNFNNGKTIWQTALPTHLRTAPTVDNGVVIVGGTNAVLYALNQNTGKILWQTLLSDPAVAPAVINNNIVFVKTLDGQLFALNLANGSMRWRYAHGAPLMMLAGGSQPIVMGKNVIVGYADGKLAAYTITQGRLVWETQVAQPKGASPVEQMVDIVANPLLSNNIIYVVNYQGNLAAISPSTGQRLWKVPMSSYTGMALTATTIFVTDAQSGVWAINRVTGQVIWHQAYLKDRLITAPTMMGNNIVIADGSGYVHWLAQSNGATVARVRASHEAISAAPVVMGNSVFIIDNDGKLVKYSV